MGPNRCPQCGTELPPQVSAERCPRCLLGAAFAGGAATSPEVTALATTSPSGVSRSLPQPGEVLGHFSITGLLGAGGMGAVFDALDLETGRRVALKVLSHSLDAPEARSRFLREGRLAASLNHPNSVYVFGTEEIDGTPVIAMELVAGGTLHDRVKDRGPMPPAEAVDAVLQVIAGLEAAQKVGILHRDVKPSNCFVAPDGTVKVGDFGLSIATSLRIEPALTTQGSFLGTPAFCSPEQLRGEELSARSDQYAVGATLYYLLTGRTPFESKNVVQLLATVLEQRPASPAQLRPGVPQGLARLVLRCLEKDPGQRYRDYAELARALGPYASAAPRPATLGLRLLAGLADLCILGVLANLLMLTWAGSPLKLLEQGMNLSAGAVGFMLFVYFLSVLYYGVPEGLKGLTPGKALLRLRVTRPDRTLPGLGRGLARAAIYMLVPGAPYWVSLLVGWDRLFDYASAQGIISSLLFYVLLAGLFSTARARNGFAAFHDLLTGTRVISSAALVLRPALAGEAPPPGQVEAQPKLGPYHVLETLDAHPDFPWLLGYDLRLLRKVWIRRAPDGTPPLSPALRGLGRIGRLRWLNGKRSPGENWDAFEALSGQPLTQLAQQPQSWRHVRFWLDDLARELDAAQQEGTMPDPLRWDQVWITAEGRAKILDLPGPGWSASIQLPPPVANSNAREFLGQVAAAALGGIQNRQPQPIERPLSLTARRFLANLPGFADLAAVRAALKPLLQRPPDVTRGRRAAIVAGCVVFPLLAMVGSLAASLMFQNWNRAQPAVYELSVLLQQRASMRFWAPKQQPPFEELLGISIAHRYADVVTNAAVWQGPLAKALIQGESRRFAETSISRHAAASPEAVREADEAMQRFRSAFNPFDLRQNSWVPAMVFSSTMVMYVALPAGIAALLFRGGLVLLTAGVTFVNRRGQRASRWRLFWRVIVAWSPLGLGLAAFLGSMELLGILGAALLGWAAIGLITLASLLLPERGLPDRLAGTWPVPR